MECQPRRDANDRYVHLLDGKLYFASNRYLICRLTIRNNLGLIRYRRTLNIVLRVTYTLKWLDINIGAILETPSAIVEHGANHGANLSHHCMSNNSAPSLQRLYPV